MLLHKRSTGPYNVTKKIWRYLCRDLDARDANRYSQPGGFLSQQFATPLSAERKSAEYSDLEKATGKDVSGTKATPNAESGTPTMARVNIMPMFRRSISSRISSGEE